MTMQHTEIPWAPCVGDVVRVCESGFPGTVVGIAESRLGRRYILTLFAPPTYDPRKALEYDTTVSAARVAYELDELEPPRP